MHLCQNTLNRGQARGMGHTEPPTLVRCFWLFVCSRSVLFWFSGFAVWVVSCGQVLSCLLSGLNRAPPSCGRALSLLARGVYEGTEEREARSFFCGAAMCVCNAVDFSLPGVVSPGVIDGWIWM